MQVVADLDRADFETWLSQHGQEEIVGTAFRATSCPITQWLRTKDLKVPEVDAHHLRFIRDAKFVEQLLPEWAKKFVLYIDLEYHNFEDPVTAGKALAVLQ